ncbi:PGPGW domain-containing protein [Candidatus Saccharibacteria bacterium]|nr:PGPGW domain-containing protein [Candidatus Saccharibacteria bacterium]
MNKAYRAARKAAIAVLGFSIIIVGLALLVLPGPGILVIIAGLAVLAIEFTWAERHLNTLKSKASQAAKKVTRKKPPS